MLAFRTLFYLLLKCPLKLLVRYKIITDSHIITESAHQPIFYIVRHRSASDLLTLQSACKKQNLPDPLEQVIINGKTFNRTLCLNKPTPIFSWRNATKTKATRECLGWCPIYALSQSKIFLCCEHMVILGKLVCAHRQSSNKSGGCICS